MLISLKAELQKMLKAMFYLYVILIYHAAFALLDQTLLSKVW